MAGLELDGVSVQLHVSRKGSGPSPVTGLPRETIVLGKTHLTIEQLKEYITHAH